MHNYRISLFLLVYHSLGMLSLQAQHNLAQTADSLRLLADAKFENEEDEEAYLLYEQVLPLYKQFEDPTLWSHCLKNKMWTRFYLGYLNPDSVEKYLQTIWYKNELEKAHLYRLAGYFYLFEFDKPVLALEPYEYAKSIYESAPEYLSDESNTFNVALRVYKPLGRIYSHFGDTQKALSYQEKCISLFLLQKRWEQFGKMCMDIAGTYWDNKNFDAALAITQKGLVYQDSLETYTKGALLANRAHYLAELDSLQKANLLVKEALNVLSPYRFNPDRGWDFAKSYLFQAYSIQAEIYSKLNQLNSADVAYATAISIASLLSNQGRQVSKLELGMADLKLKQKKLPEALRYCQSALKKVSPSLSFSDLYDNPGIEEIYLENVFIEGLELKARAFKAMFEQSGEQQQLEGAKECMQLVLETEKLFLQNYFFESSQWQMLEESHQRHEFLMEILYRLSQLGEDESGEEMLQVAEGSKALLLNQGVFQKKYLLSIGKEGKELLQLIGDIYELKSQITTASGDKLVEINQELADLLEKRKQLEQDLAEKYPAFHLNKPASSLSLQDIQKELPTERSIFITYFWGDAYIYQLGIGKSDFTIHQLPLTDSLINWTERYTNALAQGEAGQIMDSNYFSQWILDSYAGYRWLLLPMISGKEIDHIIVVPDRFLEQIPLEMLITQEPEAEDQIYYSSLPYLLKTANIHYSHSANAWLRSRQEESKNLDHKNYLGIAPRYFGAQDSLPPLANNQQFVKEARGNFGGKILTGLKANRDHFTEALQNERFNIIHFYGHAKGQTQSAYGSWIAFSTPHRDSTAARLKDLEIYQMQIPTDLFIFSACESGFGKDLRGEGVYNLARAAKFAGAENTLLSIWKAKAETNAVLMQAYLDNIHLGNGKAEALRQAKLAYLQNLDINEAELHPYFWSGYVMIGNDNPVNLSKPSSRVFNWLLGLAVLFSLIVATFVYKKLRKS